MTRYVVLGHGGFDPTSGSFPAEILVPAGTTLTFFADAGQALVLPRADYDSVAAKMWDQLKQMDPPIPAKGVTYNYTLFPDDTEEHRKSAESADWDGAVAVWVKAGQLYLCEGTEDTCPTPKLNVAASRHDELLARGAESVEAFKQWVAGGASGDLPDVIADFETRLEDVPLAYYTYVAEGVPDDRWQHKCDGILGQLGGDGNDLYWVACSSFMIDTPEMPVLGTSAVSGPGVADVSTWVPADSDYQEIREKNSQAVKDTPDGKTVSVVAGGAVVLIGPGHARRPADYVRRQDDVEEGQLTVTKGGAFSKGSIEVTGISAKQALIKEAIAEFSDKKVTFS